MAEVAEFHELDLLHVHYAIPHSVSALLARQMLAARGRRLPFVTTLHGTDITLVGLDRGYLPITRYAIQESDGVTAISNYLKEETVHDFGVTRGIEVIPNFVNCNEYAPIKDETARAEARRRLAKPGEAILMHLSNFRPVKRVVDVVKLFALVARELPARLVLVGDGPERSAAEWLAHDLQINDRVHFMGKQERVNELLPLADLMVMPSELESFGLAALEAMACKVPSIATRVGGVPELIDDGVTGLLYPVGNVEEMAAGAVSLLKDRSRLEAMRDAGRKTAQNQFCSSLVVPQYVRYYEQVLAQPTD
jgi:N-acetyl-alpha-D-glucosaminyl L-malate synthase BshA